jgi:hypothetical protein
MRDHKKAYEGEPANRVFTSRRCSLFSRAFLSVSRDKRFHQTPSTSVQGGKPSRLTSSSPLLTHAAERQELAVL